MSRLVTKAFCSRLVSIPVPLTIASSSGQSLHTKVTTIHSNSGTVRLPTTEGCKLSGL